MLEMHIWLDASHRTDQAGRRCAGTARARARSVRGRRAELGRARSPGTTGRSRCMASRSIRVTGSGSAATASPIPSSSRSRARDRLSGKSGAGAEGREQRHGERGSRHADAVRGHGGLRLRRGDEPEPSRHRVRCRDRCLQTSLGRLRREARRCRGGCEFDPKASSAAPIWLRRALPPDRPRRPGVRVRSRQQPLSGVSPGRHVCPRSVHRARDAGRRVRVGHRVFAGTASTSTSRTVRIRRSGCCGETAWRS